MFQVNKEGKELPLAFMSKSLTAERLNWSTKVRRWKLAIQEYNFDIEHIAGEENIAADAFSRLCHRENSAEFNLGVDETPLPEEVKRKIRGVHNSIAGHNGVEKTLQKLTEKGVAPWKYMREHVRQYIQRCPICQKLDHRAVTINATPFTLASREPMRSISVDSIGPLTIDEYGNVHILVIIDDFTRFVELYAIRDVTAAHAAEALLSHLGRYGAPDKLRSDRGTQFVNDTITELLKLVGTEHVLTMAESKEENSIVERANKEVMRHLRAIILDQKVRNEWSTYLPLVQRRMNASTHSSTGLARCRKDTSETY